MASNPRSRKGQSNPAEASAEAQPAQEAQVSETTTETTPEAEAPKVEAPKVTAEQHEQNLYNAIVGFASDHEVQALQTAYREVPAAARGKVQGIAMKRAMTEGNVDMEALGEVLDAFNNLPTATKTTRTRPQVDEATQNVIRLASLMVAYQAVQESFGEGANAAHSTADEWFKSEVPESYKDTVLRLAGQIVKASERKSGGGGTRGSFRESLSDLIGRGDLPAGAALTGANDASATVNADGTITTKGESFKSLSKAAKVWRVKEDGSQTSTNGWDFWQYEGKPIGSLRKG